jgi:hypothetical protein
MTPLRETWRYVDCGAVDAFENNAQMAVLARSATDASDDRDLRVRISSVFAADDVHQADATTGVTMDDLLTALHKAVDDAKETSA